MKINELEAFLKDFAAQANNIVLKGEYSGQDMFQAVEFVKQCKQIFNMIAEKQDVEKDEK
jgi:hypothetical protein